MDFMHISGQKEATWNIIFSIFERRRGPKRRGARAPNVAGPGPGKTSPFPPSRRAWLEILENNCTDNYPNTFALCSQKAIHLLPREYGELWGDEGESGVRDNKSGSIYETRKDGGKVTMEGSVGTH